MNRLIILGFISILIGALAAREVVYGPQVGLMQHSTISSVFQVNAEAAK